MCEDWAMFGRLYIEERGCPARAVELQGAVTIGRTADNDIVLESDGVSHVHAMLLAEAGGVMLLDLGSTFGTFVDSVQALPDEPVRLVDGARISIGRAILRYAAASPASNGRDATAAPPGAPPPLAAPHLNTRFDGLAPDEAFQVGRRVSLLIWVGARLIGDARQSSRPLELPGADLASPVKLNVRVRAISPEWAISAEEPVLLAAAWGSAQIARYLVVPRRTERTKLAISVEHAATRKLVQHFRLGVLAVDTNAHAMFSARASVAGTDENWTLCAGCGSEIRASARFCPRCGRAV
jgi:hypothetical protein